MQSAAIPYRQDADGVVEMLLASRTQRRRILPEGAVAPGMLPHHSAAREAMEEAGVVGQVEDTWIGEFTASKQNDDGTLRKVRVRVFPLMVTSELHRWREDRQRDAAG